MGPHSHGATLDELNKSPRLFSSLKSQILFARFVFSCGCFGCGYAALCNLWLKKIKLLNSIDADQYSGPRLTAPLRAPRETVWSVVAALPL